MADTKLAESFGLEPSLLNTIDWSLAVRRITQDLRSDFIFAPHLSFIYNKAGEKLTEMVKSDLKSGKFNPGVPLTIEVPKSFRIRVATPSKRLGPNYSRPGSILLPRDRILYQALADQAAPTIEKKLDKKRSFSHRLAPSDSPQMFLSTRHCWGALQKALAKHSESPESKYILKIDVANFFGSLNLHTLINELNDAGFPKSLSSRLEAMLIRYTGDRSSRGILQGLYPSDLLGNFYMGAADRFFSDHGVTSARYVDDIYVFVESVDASDKLLRELIPFLRTYDLVLNEAKSVIMPKAALLTEEPDLESLFEKAVAEISVQIDEDDFDTDYGFQSEWDEEDDQVNGESTDEADLELQATAILFDSISDYPGHEENIERFCLPLFAKAGSDHAVAHVLESFKKRPSMSQIYAAYLARFLDTENVPDFLLSLIGDTSLLDWQKMWILAALSQAKPTSDAPVKAAMDILKDANRNEALRAVAAVFVGRYGDHSRRKALVSIYASVSDYIKAAIFFSSRRWPAVERANAKASWSGHSSLNELIAAAFNNN